jgi:glycosyltransferase involved in cell wall biosynthesis
VSDLRATVALIRAIRNERPDVVHLHSSKAGALGRVAARLAGAPSIYTPHAWAFLMDGSAAQRRLWVELERMGSWLGDTIICVSADELESGRRVGVLGSRVAMIPNGVRPAPRGPERGSGTVVGCVARLAHQKGIDVLLDAAPAVLKHVPDARFMVIGDGPLEVVLRRRAAELGVADRVRFRTDLVGDARSVLSAIDVFVLPSRWEGMPIALLEAAAAGLPCIASRVGGVEEVLEDGVSGIVVTPERAAELATAVVQLLRDSFLRRRMGRAARERVSVRFGVDRMVRDTELVYLETALAKEFRV